MIKGIDQTHRPENIPNGYIYWGKNGVLNYLKDTVVNEKGTVIEFNLSIYNIQFLAGHCVLGKYIIIFYKSNGNEDCILVLDEKTKQEVLLRKRTDLGFNALYPIEAEAKLNSKDEVIVVFTDYLNLPRYVNLSVVSDSSNIASYNLFSSPEFVTSIQAEVKEGGGLKAGAYFIAYQYIDRDRTRTQFSPLSKPVYVTNVEESETYLGSKGNATGIDTTKAIKITLSGLDIAYNKIAVVAITSIKGVVTQKYIKEINYTGTSASLIYAGSEFAGNITLEEIIAPRANYTKARHVKSLNNNLFLADLKAAVSKDYQEWANSAIVNCVSTFDTNITLYNSAKARPGNTKSFLHDEVYAIYVQFEELDGTLSDWFHIPGRIAQVGEKDNISISTGGLEIEGRTPKVYEVMDTSSTISSSTSAGVQTVIQKMSYWENSNEVYPASYGSLAGQNVRHHKFPSIDNLAFNHADCGLQNLSNLDVQVSIPLLNLAQVKGYRLGYAKRTIENSTILGMGLTMFGARPTNDSNVQISSGGNFNIDYVGYTGSYDTTLTTNYLRFNSFDIWQNRPALTGAYLRNYLQLRAYNLQAFVNINQPYGAIRKGETAGFPDVHSYISNYTFKKVTASGIGTEVSRIFSSQYIRKLADLSYIPNNVTFIKDNVIIHNLGAEETVIARIEGSALDITDAGGTNTITVDPGAENSATGLKEVTFLAALKLPKADLFLDFESQEIVPFTEFVRVATPALLYSHGDCFVGVYSYVASGKYRYEGDSEDNIINFKVHCTIGRHNSNLRYIKEGDYSTYFYPDGGSFRIPIAGNAPENYWFLGADRVSANWNKFLYDKDYSALNTYIVSSIYNREVEKEDTFKYRIIRSLKSSDEAIEDNWKNFPLLDYFETVRNRGAITNLEAFANDTLLIHHEAALFRTRDKAVLRTDLLGVTLGSGDIFEIEPREENSSPTGTGGTQHSKSCILTDSGYYFYDKEGYTFYRYDGQQLVDIGKGVTNFLSEYIITDKDNPLNEEGITVAFDPFYYRLLLSHKAITNSFTLSYDLENQEWAFAHDYLPDLLFNTRSNLYSFKGLNLHTHNIGDFGKYYGQTYPFYIDIVINNEPTEQKILKAIAYVAKIIKSNNSVDHRKTLTHITIWNDQYCTGRVELLTNETDSLFVDSNIKVVDELWSFNSIKDKVINPELPFIDTVLNDYRPLTSNITDPVWYDEEPLRGKFFIVRLEYSNNENKELHLQNIIPLLAKSIS